MKATRKPLTAECYKYTGNIAELTEWLELHGCSNIKCRYNKDKMNIVTFKHITSKYECQLCFSEGWYILNASDWWSNSVFTAMTNSEFNHLYTIDEEQ